MNEYSDKDNLKNVCNPIFMQNLTLEKCQAIEANTDILKFVLATGILQNISDKMILKFLLVNSCLEFPFYLSLLFLAHFLLHDSPHKCSLHISSSVNVIYQY